MREPTDIIRNVRLTEKGTALASSANQYVFEVHPRATKIEIRNAVERIFNKKVTKVNTLHVRGKLRRQRRPDEGWTSDWKKAIVTLAEGQSISVA